MSSKNKDNSQNKKKQFPSISLSKQIENYKAYRSYQNRKRSPNTPHNLHENEERSNLNMSNMSSVTIQDRYYLQAMPSIHQNQCENLINQQNAELPLQEKIFKILQSTKREQQWRLYMTKSQLVLDKSKESQQLQKFLLKFILKTLEKKEEIINKIPDDIQILKSNQTLKFNQTFTELLDKKQQSERMANTFLNSKQSKQESKININTTFLNTPANKTCLTLKGTKDKLSSMTLQQKLQQQINRLNLQNTVLNKKLEVYTDQIKQLQKQVGLDKNQFLNKTTNGENNQELIQNIVDKNKYKNEAEFKKIQNQTLNRELAMMKDLNFKMKQQLGSFEQKYKQLQIQNEKCRSYLRYKELWLMQNEECMHWKDKYLDRVYEIQKLNNKIKILKEKNKQLLHSFNFSMVVNPDQEEDKQDLQNIIKSFQEWLKVISVPRVNYPAAGGSALSEELGISQGQYMPTNQNVNYKLLSPSFFIFFQSYEKTITMEKNILNTRPIESTFFVKIRAIFDSMYNHFNIYSSYRDWVSFPEFVVGFLEKYQINFSTHQIQLRKKPMLSQEKLTFLMNVFNKKLSNTWQCEMFRSFLVQDYTLDEIYFFLDCRNDLNGGNTLKHGFGTSDPVTYVKLQKALITATRKLAPYQNHIIQRVKNILKSKKKQKNGEAFIDRHFVLKLLLEVYALEKVKSQRIFEATFKGKNKKVSIITYADYLAFMLKNFKFLTSIDIAKLYRQIYTLSSGKVTYKAIHYICLKKGLFIPLIWSKRLNLNVLQKSLNSDMILLDIQNGTRKINSHLIQLGVQGLSQIESDVNIFLRQLDWYRNNRFMFYFKMMEQKIKIMRANCFIEWQTSTFSPDDMLTTQEIRDNILHLHNLVHNSDHSINFLSKKKEEREKAIKILTRNFKIRIQQSMREFRRIDEEELKRLKQQVKFEVQLRQLKNGVFPAKKQNQTNGQNLIEKLTEQIS